jgi:hypothetical protein
MYWNFVAIDGVIKNHCSISFMLFLFPLIAPLNPTFLSLYACLTVSIFPWLPSVLFLFTHFALNFIRFPSPSAVSLFPTYFAVVLNSDWRDACTNRTKTRQLRLRMNKHFPWQWTSCRGPRLQKCVICRTCINSRGCRVVRAVFV